MKTYLPKLQSLLANLILLGLFGFTLYYMLRYLEYGGDIKVHNNFLGEYLENGYFPIPPGYYSLIYVIDLLIRIKHSFVVSSLIVLSIFIWWKFRILLLWLRARQVLDHSNSFWFALALVFFGPLIIPQIDGDFWYFGKFTATIWHNSTLIAALPFSLLLFQRTINWWKNSHPTIPWDLFGLGFLILLIKPSFLFCYIPMFPLFTWISFSWKSEEFRSSLLVSLALLGLIWIEKVLIYSWDPMVLDYFQKDELPKIQIRPFKIWLHYAFEPAWDFFSSFALTFIFFIFWGKKALKNLEFAFSFALLIISLLIYFLLAESGYRVWHANFYWQIPITLLIHQFLMLTFVLEKVKLNLGKIDLKLWIFFALFGLHVCSGIAYWLRIFTGFTLS